MWAYISICFNSNNKECDSNRQIKESSKSLILLPSILHIYQFLHFMKEIFDIFMALVKWCMAIYVFDTVKYNWTSQLMINAASYNSPCITLLFLQLTWKNPLRIIKHIFDVLAKYMIAIIKEIF